MSKVSFTYHAREDLLDIWVHIALRNLAAADRVYDRIEESCRQLQTFPELGTARPDIAPDARMLVVERWLALYRLLDDGVQVVRIVDGARDLGKLEWMPG